jgi:hypothetical protein
MQRHDEFSNFRSAIEWPEMRPPREEATGELRPISSSVISTVEILSSAVTIAPDCESPIEVDLGARLSSAIRRIDDSNLLLVPQYVLGPYRYDFAIIREGKPIALIECDGFEKSGQCIAVWCPINARIQSLTAEYPTQPNREFPNAYQGILFEKQGNSAHAKATPTDTVSPEPPRTDRRCWT